MEAYGPAHSRASSGGETRIIRMGYGADELYTTVVATIAGAMEEFFSGFEGAVVFMRPGALAGRRR